MSCCVARCSPIAIARPNPPSAELGLPSDGGTRLITAPNDPQTFTSNRETDARTAITRGLREYLEQLAIDVVGGQQLRFQQVFQTWSEPETHALYPAAIVYAREAGEYDMSKFTPGVQSNLKTPDGKYVVSGSEFVQNLVVEVWANSPEERMGLVGMVEDALLPVEWRYGPLLELPHYFNARASYEKMTMSYDDTEIDAVRRYRKATFVVKGRVPVIRLFEFPGARPRARLDVT